MEKNRGFTLIEMMIVIAVISILSAVAIPNYISHRNNQQVSRAARQIYSAFQAAKMTAIRDNSTICILFTPGTGSSGTFQMFEDKNGNNSLDTGEDIAIERMPAGITMRDASFSSDAQATFNFMGLPRQSNGAMDFGSVEVSNSVRCSEIRIGSSGSIRIDKCQ